VDRELAVVNMHDWAAADSIAQVFRIAADLSHITAKCILIFSIHRNRSSEGMPLYLPSTCSQIPLLTLVVSAGVSLLTQLFYALVFVTRYTDLFRESSAWNYFFKIFFLLSSFYTIGVMRFVYPRTREREVAWKLSALVLVVCLAISPFVMLIFNPAKMRGFQEVRSLLSLSLLLITPDSI
jgi:hypothetical protein